MKSLINRRFVIAVLVVACLMTVLLTVAPIRSSILGPVYDPWLDVNNDNKIDMKDIGAVAQRFTAQGAPGQNASKASLAYDSGWLNIASMAGQNMTITHGLNITDWNTTDSVVDITGKTTPDGAVLRNLGLEGRIPGWNRSYTGSYDDDNYGTCVVQTDDGGYAFAGHGTAYTVWNSIDAYLFKTDEFGVVQWVHSYPHWTGSTEVVTSLVKADGGGYVIGGYTSNNGNDAFLTKTDSIGSEVWSKFYGTAASDMGLSLIKTSDGGYAFSGQTNQGGDYDAWLVKTDSSGNLQWSRTYGGPSDDVAEDVVQTTDGGYALTGPTHSYGAGLSDWWLVRTDSNGNMLWNQAYGGSSYDEAHAIALADDGFALAGDTISFGAGSYDFWLVKTDFMGNMVWNKTYGRTGWERAYDMIPTSDGGYALTCYTNSFGAGGYDAWLVKTDENGNEQWNKTYGGAGDDMAISLIQNREGSFILVGYTMSFPVGSTNFWLVDTGYETGLAWIGQSLETIALYRGDTDLHWNYVRVRLWKPR